MSVYKIASMKVIVHAIPMIVSIVSILFFLCSLLLPISISSPWILSFPSRLWGRTCSVPLPTLHLRLCIGECNCSEWPLYGSRSEVSRSFGCFLSHLVDCVLVRSGLKLFISEVFPKGCSVYSKGHIAVSYDKVCHGCLLLVCDDCG